MDVNSHRTEASDCHWQKNRAIIPQIPFFPITKYSASELIEINRRMAQQNLSPELWSRLKILSITHKKPTRRGQGNPSRVSVGKQRKRNIQTNQSFFNDPATDPTPSAVEEVGGCVPASEERSQAAGKGTTPSVVVEKGTPHIDTQVNGRDVDSHGSYSAQQRIEHRKVKRKKKWETKKAKKKQKSMEEAKGKRAEEFSSIFRLKNKISIMYVNCRSVWNSRNRAKLSGVTREHKHDI